MNLQVWLSVSRSSNILYIYARFGSTITTKLKSSSDLFGHVGQAHKYSLYRPNYPNKIISCIVARASERNIAIDVACGSGQLTYALSNHFNEVLGFDISTEQLNNIVECNKKSNIKFAVSIAEKIPVPDQTASLVTIAQALHWVNQTSFFAEIDRVLIPSGAFAAIGYGICRLSNLSMQKIFENYYINTLGGKKYPGENGCWWACNRPSLDQGYEDVKFPYVSNLFRIWEIEKRAIPFSHFISYLETMSAYHTFKQYNEDPLPNITQQLLQAGNLQTTNDLIDTEFPFFANIMNKP